MKELTDIIGCKAIYYFKRDEKDLEDNSVFYGKPVESSEDRCNMVGFLGFGDKSGSGVLD